MKGGFERMGLADCANAPQELANDVTEHVEGGHAETDEMTLP